MFLIWPKVLEKGRFFFVIALISIESESPSWIWITYSNWLYHANERTRHCCLKIFLIEQLSILVVTESDCLLHEMYLKNWLYLNYSFVFKKSFDIHILRLDINVTPIEKHKIISLHRIKIMFGSQVCNLFTSKYLLAFSKKMNEWTHLVFLLHESYQP